MNNSKIYGIFIFLFLLFYTNYFAQQSSFDERLEAKNLFQYKYENKGGIRWNSKTNTPFSILGYNINKYSGTPEKIANSFLVEEKIMLGIQDVQNDLLLDKTNYSKKGGTRLLFKQMYKGVPVLLSGYLIAINNEGVIYYVSGDYYPQIEINVKPALAKETIIGIVKEDMKDKEVDITEPELFVFPTVGETENESCLVYRVTVQSSESIGTWKYIIDANSGEIIEKKDLIEQINGSGSVYQTNPNNGTPVTRTLYNLLDISPRELNGTNVIVENSESSEATSPTGEFIYSTINTHFDEVMAYYHADMFESFLVEIGMETNRVGKFTIYTHYDHDSVYASTNPLTRIMYLADQDPSSYGRRDPAKEAAVICHEYMHGVSETYHSLNSGIKESAMDEAYSDYFALAYKNNQLVNSSIIGEYIDPPGGLVWSRNLANTWTMDDYETIDLEPIWGSSKHDKSVIFSGGLWDFRTDNDVSATVADELILESLNNLDNFTNFIDGRDALIAAAYSAGYSSYVDDINAAFWNHKIGTPPLSLTILGPSSLTYKEVGNFTADVDGGSGFFTYQWYRSNNGGSTWSPAGTSQMQSSTMVFDDFIMRCDVHDTQTGSDISATKNVYYGLQKISSEQNEIVENYSLHQNYPNPFNPTTEIKYTIKDNGFVTLKVYDPLGKEIKVLVNEYKSSGSFTVNFDANNLPSGVYFYKIESGKFRDVKKMILLR